MAVLSRRLIGNARRQTEKKQSKRKSGKITRTIPYNREIDVPGSPVRRIMPLFRMPQRREEGEEGFGWVWRSEGVGDDTCFWVKNDDRYESLRRGDGRRRGRRGREAEERHERVIGWPGGEFNGQLQKWSGLFIGQILMSVPIVQPISSSFLRFLAKNWGFFPETTAAFMCYG
ncbi:hypothetical protein K438DRAFT_1759887 [Mycena galopus ATCC 62051]|nr:hypothetical protein K438DRAFT_1759887 [Mycena galopus ATCC 62051]